MSEYLLEMRNIRKSFAGVKALDGIDLRVQAGECVGLCGENGAGKSTLMKVLSAVYPHGTWEGEILWQGQPLAAHTIRETEEAGIVIIHQELMLVPELSVTENIFLGNEITLPGGRLNYAAMHQRAQALMKELEMPDVNVALPVSVYGGGQQQLVEIAKALNKKARLLILDEPSSSLTTAEIRVLLNIIKGLKARGVACVYISHKLDEVAEIGDTITVIRDGTHIGTQPMSTMSVDRIISMMVGRDIANLYPREPHEVGEVVLEARNITCYDVSNPQRRKVKDVSFNLRKGEILGIAGLVGAGRTELVSALFGAWRGKSEGTVYINGKVADVSTPEKAIRNGICMVPEDRKHHGIVPEFGVGWNISLPVLGQYTHLGRIDKSAELKTVMHEIGRLRIKTASPHLQITGLSGGNQQKVVLAKMLQPKPDILILDEPTRGVDVGAKYEIYKLMFDLARQGISIIMVSSELAEVLGVSDRVLVMGEGELRGEFSNEGLTQEQVLAAALKPIDEVIPEAA
ncbi:D-xylose ABC transporter ATP-binding protein [Silvimonas amylolytica]|uniref:Xylose import ATP-binding protein XylG n=1 Tax=Silvimonas amylolytica TaxID=449663 RepID=A0ABQ2PI46_9NEIS|nr:D-xylose ABC transporter ATP-binding protein [Silvimonas amylolytica]GGP25279.1 xylose import ATP-binding protein XylG [Silvimonas amylolytica]